MKGRRQQIEVDIVPLLLKDSEAKIRHDDELIISGSCFIDIYYYCITGCVDLYPEFDMDSGRMILHINYIFYYSQ